MLNMLKIGDSVDGIYKRTKDGKEEWYLLEDIINKIVETKNGRKYYTKSKFRPLDADDIDDNTEISNYEVEEYEINHTVSKIATDFIMKSSEGLDIKEKLEMFVQNGVERIMENLSY